MERRLVAIMAADMVGYSRLMGADEEGTIARQKTHRGELIDPTIAEHDGRIVKTTGDGLLVEFPSVVDAVRCTVAIQRAMVEREADVPEERRIRYRVGVNLGDIVIDGDDILGDGVNVTARLEGLAEPGGICIPRKVFHEIRNKLDVGYEFIGEQKVKNIGTPVPVYRVLLESDARGKVVGEGRLTRQQWKLGAVAAAMVAAVAVVAVWWQPWGRTVEPSSLARIAPPLPDKPSIAVMPFKNLSQDPAEDYLSEGFTEDIINALGRYQSLAVMTYNAVLPYRNQSLQPSEVGRNLGVRYLLEGSVRRAGKRVRVSARLTDVDSGRILWSDTFDDEKADIFAVQDTITQEIAGRLGTKVRKAEVKRSSAKQTDNLDAYDLVLKGRAQIARASRRGNREARHMFERAIELDPDYAAAYAWLARVHFQLAMDGWTEFPGEALNRADELATKALTIDPELVEAHRTLGRVYTAQVQLERAIIHIDSALALNPSDAEAYGDRGMILLWPGRLEEAATALETAFRFDPNLRSDYVFAYGLALYSLGRHEDAITILERGAARHRTYVFIPAVLVAAYGQIGRMKEARRNAQIVKRLLPIFDEKTFGKNFQKREHFDYLAEGLKKGGGI
jgi:adenylate cyclase